MENKKQICYNNSAVVLAHLDLIGSSKYIRLTVTLEAEEKHCYVE